VRLRAKAGVILPHYLNFYLNSDLGQRRLLAYATPGVSQTNISAGNLKRVLVPIPSLQEQTTIVKVLRDVEARKEELAVHLVTTRALKKSLMRRLLIPAIDE
jgi:restriction endonuclease S subunit